MRVDLAGCKSNTQDKWGKIQRFQAGFFFLHKNYLLHPDDKSESDASLLCSWGLFILNQELSSAFIHFHP